MKAYLKGALAVAFLTTALTWCHAWWVKGHETVTEAACAGLPDDVPAFFRAGSKALAHYSGDPDRWKNRDSPYLTSAEAPNHFLDMEDFEGRKLPATRWEAIALLQELKKKPEKVGMLPWAILENYDRLSCAFTDLRADPENAAIRAKCLVYAGVLAHLTGDSAMPLHTTRDYDGRTQDKMAQKGIHARIDGFPEKHGITAEEVTRRPESPGAGRCLGAHAGAAARVARPGGSLL